MRKLESDIPTLEKLGLSPVFHEMIKEKNGIIFVTGATGSGKTTTLAAMLNELNRTQDIHVLTLEDPIEFVHPTSARRLASVRWAKISSVSQTGCARPCGRRPR